MTDFLLCLAIIAGMLFVGMQGIICVAMPQEWFIGAVAGVMLALITWFRYRK